VGYEAANGGTGSKVEFLLHDLNPYFTSHLSMFHSSNAAGTLYGIGFDSTTNPKFGSAAISTGDQIGLSYCDSAAVGYHGMDILVGTYAAGTSTYYADFGRKGAGNTVDAPTTYLEAIVWG